MILTNGNFTDEKIFILQNIGTIAWTKAGKRRLMFNCWVLCDGMRKDLLDAMNR